MSGRVLDGIRILDLTRIVAGPFATVVLADLGADVIKVERPGSGDDYRYGPSPKGELSLSFQNTNRGKRSITLDVRVPEGRDIFLRLVENADAVVENFRSGWLADQGLAPAVIQERNPRCVVASLSGFGATGPRAGQASYDIVAQATGGLLAMTGFADRCAAAERWRISWAVSTSGWGSCRRSSNATARVEPGCSTSPTRTPSSRSPTPPRPSCRESACAASASATSTPSPPPTTPSRPPTAGS